MIVPMKRVTLLALGSECENALTALRALGVMQIQPRMLLPPPEMNLPG